MQSRTKLNFYFKFFFLIICELSLEMNTIGNVGII